MVEANPQEKNGSRTDKGRATHGSDSWPKT